MKFNFFPLLLLIPACIYCFNLTASDNLDCKSSNVQCLSNNTFTTCTNANNVTYLVNKILTCPDGYYCDDDGNGPCTNASKTDETTTVVSTTRYTVARPTTAPTCNKTNIGYIQAASTCNQYYVCTKTTVLFITKYTAVLTTCDDDLVFSITYQSCVSESLSDCP